MALIVTGEVQGHHSTPVDMDYYLQALREMLASIAALQDCKGRVNLQVRAVRVPRRKHEPGIVAIGFNVCAPRSIDVLCFSNEATGRPATLVVGDDALIALILQALAPRLYEAWSNSCQGTDGATRDHLGMKPQKAMRNARRKDSVADAVKAIICELRSTLKSNPGGHALAFYEHSQEGVLTDHEMLRLCGWEETQQAGLVCARPMLDSLVQFGFIELPPAYQFDDQVAQTIRLSDYCKMMAQAWIDEENERRLAQWQLKLGVLAKQLGGKEFRLVDLLKQRATLQEEIATLNLRIEKLQAAQPELLESIEI